MCIYIISLAIHSKALYHLWIFDSLGSHQIYYNTSMECYYVLKDEWKDMIITTLVSNIWMRELINTKTSNETIFST